MDTKPERVLLGEKIKKLYMEQKGKEVRNKDEIKELFAKIEKLKQLEKK